MMIDIYTSNRRQSSCNLSVGILEGHLDSSSKQERNIFLTYVITPEEGYSC